jgi:hypothetical protein
MSLPKAKEFCCLPEMSWAAALSRPGTPPARFFKRPGIQASPARRHALRNVIGVQEMALEGAGDIQGGRSQKPGCRRIYSSPAFKAA